MKSALMPMTDSFHRVSQNCFDQFEWIDRLRQMIRASDVAAFF